MFRRVLNTTVRATLTLFLRDFFENVTSQNFEDLRVGTSIHVVLRNLAIKRQIADEILKTTPLKLLHCGLERLQAELTLNTKQARQLLLQEVHVVLEFNPDWVPPPPSNDAPPPIPSGISGAAAIVYSANTGEVLEDSFLRDDMKAILSKRNFNEEEAIKMPEDAVDRSASAVAALLKELVHHSEVAIDGFTVRIRFPPSKNNNNNKSSSSTTTTNEILIRFPSIFIRDKTVFDGKPSDQFSKFISIAPPIIQVYPLTQEDLENPISSTERDLSYEDTLAMGYGFLHASSEMERCREETAAAVARNKEREENASKNTNDNSNTNNDPPEDVDALDFTTIMDSQRCVTIEVARGLLQPGVPTWDVRISTTPFLICARPYQIGLLLDIGFRVSAQTKLQERVLREREEELERQEEMMLQEKERQESQNYPRNFYSNQNFSSNNNHNNTKSLKNSSTNNNNNNNQTSKSSAAPPTTFIISAKCQHGVVALFSTDDLEPVAECWESIEDYDSFIGNTVNRNKNNNNNNNNDDYDDDACGHLPMCLAKQRGYFALSAGSGKIVIEKNNSKNSIKMATTTNQEESSTSSSNNNSSPTLGLSQQQYQGETEMERFLDRFTETTFTASLGSLVFVERASRDPKISAVKIIQVGELLSSSKENNNNNNKQNTTAGEIILKITEAVPFHEVLKYKCINLSGVRHRHPTTSEAYSKALLRSTVTVKDVVLNSSGKAVIRIEPTVLSRVVDLMNYMNTEIIAKSMERNGVPLPKLKDVVDKNEESKNNNNNALEEEKNNSNSNNIEPFNDDAMTISMNFSEVDLQCLLLKSRMPAPDIWGPLTCRLFDHLAEYSTKGHLLPRSFVIRGNNMKFVTSPGTEPTLAQLTITSAEALVQQENGASRTLLRISPTSKIPNFSLQASVKSNPFGVSDVTKLDKIANEISQRPTSDQRPVQEALKNELSSVAVDIQIPRVHGVTDILMDDMIFVLFAVTDLSELTLPLVRYVPLDETAAYVAAKSFIPNSVVSVNLLLQEIQLFVGAPRLDKHGVCLGEPLSSLLPPEQAPRNLTFALHRYEIRATELTLTLGIAAITQVTQHWGLALGLGGFSLREHLLQLDGHPGAIHILCDSFADAHRRSYEGTADRRRGRSGRVLNLTLIRDTCLRKRSDLMQIGIVVECVSLVQQAAHDGDSWPAVLAFWSADTPTHVKAGQRVHSRGAVQKADVIPLSAAITVNITARDLLLDWKAEMRKERLAVLVSALEVEIPELVTGDPKLTATIRVREPAALLLHNDFPTPIIEFDRAMFVSGINIFGSTRKGALDDLMYLGFAQLCTIGPRPSSTSSSTSNNNNNNNNHKTPTIVVRKSHPSSNRKLQVEVHHFFTEFSFAPDSCALFIAFLEHVQDPKYISQCVTPPLRLARRAGGLHYSHITPSVQQIEHAPARAYVQDFDFIDELQYYRTNSNNNDNSTTNSQIPLGNNNNNNNKKKNKHNLGLSAHKTRGLTETNFNSISDWDLPEFDDHGREKSNFNFVMKENAMIETVVGGENGEEVEKHPKTLSQLMSDIYYFQPPIFDESAIAEPLFNVPSKIEFELLLHSCDFKVSFFAGSDFELLKENGRGGDKKKQQHQDPNNNNNINSSRFGFDDEDITSNNNFANNNNNNRENSSTIDDDYNDDEGYSNSFHSITATIPIFDVTQRRQRKRRARNSTECVALWLMHCFTQIDIFPSIDDEDDDENDAASSSADENEGSSSDDGNNSNNNTNSNSNSNSKQKSKNKKEKRQKSFVPVRQIIFRAGDIEVEDLVHESPVRKMLYCALPKTQRDAPVVTLRVRTLQKHAESDDDDDEEIETFQRNNNRKNNTNSSVPNSQTSFNGGGGQEFEMFLQKKIFQNLEAQQVSLRLLPLGINISARTVMKVISAFVNMKATRVALTNQQPLPSIASAASSLASLAHTQHSGIAGIRPLDSTSNLHNQMTAQRSIGGDTTRSSIAATADHPVSHSNNIHQNQESSPIAADITNNISAPPTFFEKLILHPLDLRISWFPDESVYSDKQLADALGSQWLLYVVRYLAIEGARLSLSRISLTNVKMEDVSERIMVEAWPQLKASKLLLLFAGLQPVRPAAEIAGALGDLVLTPLEYWQHQRSIFVGIARGLQTCTSRLAAESLTISATGTRLGQHAALAVTKGIQRNPTPLLWGNQPQSVGEGAYRALKSAEKGLLDFGSGVMFCVDEMKQSSVSGGLMRLPLSFLIPVEGVLRGMTEAILGVRNTIRPEERMRDTQEYKSSVFSHKRGDSDDDDDDQNENDVDHNKE